MTTYTWGNRRIFEKGDLVKGKKSQQQPFSSCYFYFDALKKEKNAPSILRTDCGTENGAMAGIQCYLHQNAEALNLAILFPIRGSKTGGPS